MIMRECKKQILENHLSKVSHLPLKSYFPRPRHLRPLQVYHTTSPQRSPHNPLVVGVHGTVSVSVKSGREKYQYKLEFEMSICELEVTKLSDPLFEMSLSRFESILFFVMSIRCFQMSILCFKMSIWCLKRSTLDLKMSIFCAVCSSLLGIWFKVGAGLLTPKRRQPRWPPSSWPWRRGWAG